MQYARGQVLDLLVTSETYPISGDGLRADLAVDADIPFLDVVATVDQAAGMASVFILNRDLDGSRDLVLDWRDLTPSRVVTSQTLTGSDVKAGNTFDRPNQVVPQQLDAPAVGSTMTFRVPPRSYSVVQLALG